MVAERPCGRLGPVTPGPGDAAPGPGAPDAPDASASVLVTELVTELATELARVTGVSWVRAGGRSWLVWHAWSDGALCLVSGGAEQPLPEISDGAQVEVVMRSKDTGGRLLTWTGTASVVRPGGEAWERTTAALVERRHNLPDPGAAAEVWARDSVVRRVVPVAGPAQLPAAGSPRDADVP